MKIVKSASLALSLIVCQSALAQNQSPPAAPPAKAAPGDPQAIPVWQSGFENPSLGDWTYLGSEALSKDGKTCTGRNESYMVTSENVFAGKYVYKGWISATQSESHRAYPCEHFKTESPVVNSWYAWLDCNPAKFSNTDWIHFVTICNSNYGPGLITMSVRSPALELEMAHCEWKWVGPADMRKFPLKRWVRFTYYSHYKPAGDGKIWIWMDGRLIFEGSKNHPNQFLERAHWGMYASGHVDNGVQYNDEIQVWRLASPWTDKNREPASPYVNGAAQQSVAVAAPEKPKVEAKPKQVIETTGKPEVKPKPVVTGEKLETMEDWVAKLKSRLALYIKSGQAPRFACRALDAKVTVESIDGNGQLTLLERGGKKSTLEWDKLTIDDYIGLAKEMAGMTDTALDHALLAYFYNVTEQTDKAQEHLKKAGSYEKAVKDATGL